MIWSSMDMLDDEAREQYQELQREVQEDDTYTVSDAEWADVVSGSLTDERLNLDTPNATTRSGTETATISGGA